MAVSESDVIWAYRTFLGRDPENHRVVLNHRVASNLRSLCESFIGSAEFKARSGVTGQGDCREPLAVLLPKLSIDTSANADELRHLWTHVRRTWEHLGDKHPFYSVITEERYTPERINESETQFWQSGQIEAEELADYLRDLGLTNLNDAVLLDYGSGVGRVTIPLAAIAREVVAYDLSEPHLKLARERAAVLGRTNIRLVALGDALPTVLEPCDVFYSRIVLQHNPPPLIGHLIRVLIRSLRRGGVGVFQVPTYYVGYRYKLREAIHSPRRFEMEMHCYPQAHLFTLIAEEGARLVQVRDDDAPGRRELFVSNTFVIAK
jgi:SAM-dependent methyltransferase